MDRYALKEPYCLWVPSETPETPARVGHDMWFHTPEDESAPREMRVMYWLNDQCNQNASDVNMVVVNPALAECPPPTPGDGTINTMYGGDDADQDGEPDGIKVYEFADDDPPGTWRCLWTAADACGPFSAHRRTHDEQRMLVANQANDLIHFFVCHNTAPSYEFGGNSLRIDTDWVSRWLHQHGIPYVIKAGNVDVNPVGTNVKGDLDAELEEWAEDYHVTVFSAAESTTSGFNLIVSAGAYGGTERNAGTEGDRDMCFMWTDMVAGEGQLTNETEKLVFRTHLYLHELGHALDLGDETPPTTCIMQGAPSWPRWKLNWPPTGQPGTTDPWAPHAAAHRRTALGHLRLL